MWRNTVYLFIQLFERGFTSAGVAAQTIINGYCQFNTSILMQTLAHTITIHHGV